MATIIAHTAGSYTHFLEATVTSQNIGANTSAVLYHYWIRNNGSLGYGAWDFDGGGFAVWESTGGNRSAAIPYDFRAYSTKTMFYFTQTVTHNSAGYATISASIAFAGNTTYFPAISASASMTLPRIPKVPLAPATPTFGTVTPSSVHLNWNAPDNMGAGITSYTVQFATNSDFTTGVATKTFGNVTSGTVSDIAPGRTYWFRVRAHNSRGAGPYSGSRSVSVGLPAPTLVSWTQDASAGLRATWEAPGVTTGLTGYRVQVATDSSFTAGVELHDIGNTLAHTVEGLAGGRQYWVRVAARTAGGVNSYSASLKAVLILDSGDIDGWTRVGTKPTNVQYYTAEGLRRGSVWNQQALWVESISTGPATLPSDTLGIQKTVTGLTIGKAYRFQSRGSVVWPAVAKSYRLKVVGHGQSDAKVLGDNMPMGFVEFVANSTSATLQIVLASGVSVSEATAPFERAVFHTIQLLELDTSYPQRLRETVYESNLANHFDLASNSVGATWHVGKDGITRFTLPGTALPVSAVFSDKLVVGGVSYVDVSASYDTRSMVNKLNVTNYGVDDTRLNEENDDLVASNSASINKYGVREESLSTNLYGEAPYEYALDDRLDQLLDNNSEPRLLISALRWNAQEDLSLANKLEVGQRVTVSFKETTQDSQIVSINHDISPMRWIITLTLQHLL